jgi:hypothetical protein
MARSLRTAITAGLIGIAAPLVMVITASPASATPVTSAAPAVATVAAKASAKHITIPGNYVYNPNAKKQRTLHDYCTKSPDSFPNPVGKNADFRGPCARHDMCIQYKQHKRSTCDANLLANMRSECNWTYSGILKTPIRSACNRTAAVYWAVVRVKTVFS